MKRLVISTLFCLATIPLITNASENMPPEEVIVRTTYARLAYAVQLGTIHTALRNKQLDSDGLNSQLAQDQIWFEFSNFKVGNIADIAGAIYADLVSKPSGDILATTPATFSFKEELNETSEINAVVRWTRGQELTEDWNVPFQRVIREMENANWYSRYAAFTVRLKFRQLSRSYNALFLFGKNDKGEEDVKPIDVVTGNSALYLFTKQSVYPATLLGTKLRKKEVVANWLKSNQVFDAACQAGKRDICCNLTTLKCGLPAQDVQSALSEPLSEIRGPSRTASTGVSPSSVLFCGDWDFSAGPYNNSDIGYDYHITGNHSWAASTWGSCAYTGDTGTCLATATADASAGMGDYGLTSSPCHVQGWNKSDAVADGTSPTARSVAAGAVRTCLFCTCSTSINIFAGVITFPSDSFFQRQYNYSISCPSQESPIVVDTTGKGFRLTSVEAGVVFDIRGNGDPVRMSWTDESSGNAFLALDRNGNG